MVRSDSKTEEEMEAGCVGGGRVDKRRMISSRRDCGVDEEVDLGRSGGQTLGPPFNYAKLLADEDTSADNWLALKFMSRRIEQISKVRNRSIRLVLSRAWFGCPSKTKI